MLVNKLKYFLEEQVTADEFSGVVLIIKDGESILEYMHGFSNIEKQIPISIDTKFNIGSMDKMFTAVAIARLVQEKKLNFQDKIIKYLPDFPKESAEKITVHHILTHTEGFDSYFNEKYRENRLQLKTVSDYLDLFQDNKLLFTPGEKYQYSNSGYVVLGAIIEAISSKSYYEFIKENIFLIADMQDSGSFSLDKENIVTGYTYRKPFSEELCEKRQSNINHLPYRGSPAGGGYSTCWDLHNFSKALLEEKLLNSELTDEVLTPKEIVGTKNGTTLHYGYGFQILDVGDGNYRYGHGGAFAGANARLDMYPWLGYTVVVLSNYDQPAAFRIANRAGELILTK